MKLEFIDFVFIMSFKNLFFVGKEFYFYFDYFLLNILEYFLEEWDKK